LDELTLKEGKVCYDVCNHLDEPLTVLCLLGQSNANTSGVLPSILARSIYDEFYSPKSTFKPAVSKNDRPNRYSRFNAGSPQTSPAMPKAIKVEPVEEQDSFVEDSLDAMVKEIRDLLLDNRKSPVSVAQQTTTLVSTIDGWWWRSWHGSDQQLSFSKSNIFPRNTKIQ
jgi:hypothetical protein